MERVKIKDNEYKIISIEQYANLLKIEFEQEHDLSHADLTSIVVLTNGGINCATLLGYTTIYKTDENSVILSNDGSVYTEPVISEPIEPYIPTAEEIRVNEITSLKVQIADTDYKVIKCMEYQLTGKELPYDIIALHEDRQALRDQINDLEASIS